MRRTKQVGIWSEMVSFWQPSLTQDQPAPQEGFEIDSRICEAAARAPTVSKEDSYPQAILKLWPRNHFNYSPSLLISLLAQNKLPIEKGA